MTVNGTPVPTGQASGDINLSVGNNTITVVVTAQDATINTYTITVTRALPLSVATLTLAEGIIKGSYSQTLLATGGIAPYQWSLSPGSNLPAGLNLSTAGLISGTVDAAAVSGTFTVAITDSVGGSANQLLSITIKSAGALWKWGSFNFGYSGPFNASGSAGNLGVVTAHPTQPDTNDLELKADGTVWYSDNYGIHQVTGISGVSAIAEGYGYGLAVKSDGTLWGWGSNSKGQLGFDPGSVASPTQIPGFSGVVAAAAGFEHTLVLKSDGTLWSMGRDDCGQLGFDTGSPYWTKTPTQIMSGVVSISAGNLHSVAVKSDGAVWAWGCNGDGQVGNDVNIGTMDRNPTPTQVGGLSGIIKISSGLIHNLALTSTGSVYAWGWNTDGELGVAPTSTTHDGTEYYSSTPILVSGLSNIIAVAGGYQHSMSLKSDGTVYTWGGNAYGQLGDGTTTNRFTPQAVSGISQVTGIAAGYQTSLALAPLPPLSISTSSLPDGETGVAYSAPLAVTNGFSPYIWSIVAGALPNGLPDPPVSNAIAGTPSAAGTFNFTLHCVDSSGASTSKDLSITIYPGLAINTPSTLPPGQANMTYNQTLAYGGGHGAVTWTKTAGSLPGTVTLDPATGTLSGTPSSAGTFNFTVRALDAITSVTKPMSITVNEPVISPTTLPDGEAGVVYAGATLTASGGVGTYAWSVDASSPNNLPATLVIDPATGTISGTPGTATGGPIVITFKAVDNVGAVATRSLSLTIKDAVSISTTTLPGARVSFVFNQPLAASGGASPYSWSKTSGDLGALNLDSAGTISGTPAASGTLTFTVQVTDALGGQATQSLTITISSTDATLSNLTISSGALMPVFGSDTITYTDNVTYAVSSLTVTPKVNESHATVKVNGNVVASGSPSGDISLIVGANTVTVLVTAQDNTTASTYTITVTRLSNDASLSNLTISSGTLTPSFVSGTITYTDSVANAVTSVTVTPTANESHATVKVNGNTVISGSPSGAISLSVGDNTITVVITSQDLSTQSTYTVIVNRANFSSSAATINSTPGSTSRRPQTTEVASIELMPAGSTASVTGTVGGLAGVQSPDGNAIAGVAAGTTARTRDGLPLTTITVTPMANPPAPPSGSNIIGIVYEFGPTGATFNPPITLTLRYDPNKIPSGVPETSLIMAFYDPNSGQWVPLANCVVNSGTHTVSALVSHFTTFAVIPSAPAVANSPVPGAASTALVPSQINPDKPASSQSASPTESASQSTTATSPWTYVMVVILVVLAVLVAFAIIQRVRKTKT